MVSYLHFSIVVRLSIPQEELMSTGDILVLLTIILGVPGTVKSLLAILDWLKEREAKKSS